MTTFPYSLIDLTHTLNEQIPSWDGGCGFSCMIDLDYEQCTSSVPFRVQHLKMNAGIGTHIDSPAHCNPNGRTIEQLPLSELLSPCRVIDVSSYSTPTYSVTCQEILANEKIHGPITSGTFVMIKTGWEQYWATPEHYRNNYEFPSLASEAAELLLSRDISGLGIDTLSPDRPIDGYPVHQLLLTANKYIVENVANLDQLPARGSFVMVLPIKIAQATEAPVRLVGLISKTEQFILI